MPDCFPLRTGSSNIPGGQRNPGIPHLRFEGPRSPPRTPPTTSPPFFRPFPSPGHLYGRLFVLSTRRARRSEIPYSKSTPSPSRARLGMQMVMVPANPDSMMAGNLHNKIPLCIGARVMLTENIWTAVGLVNGALGEVYDIA